MSGRHSGPDDGRNDPSERRLQPDDRTKGPEAEREDVSFLEFLIVLLRHRRLVMVAPVVVAVLVVAITLLLPRTYTTTASFTPESDQGQASQLAGVAARFGLSIPTGATGQSPEFYVDLLQSRELLSEAVVTEYVTPPDSGGGASGQAPKDLVQLWSIRGESRPVAVARAVDELRSQISVSSDQQTSVVDLAVSTRRPWLSQKVAARMVELVNEFNVETRRSQAAEEREFIGDQLAEARGALRAAEDSLELFLERNRRYQNSPQLRFEYDRLQRRVDLQQQLFTSLSESYQQAKIEEVRTTPVITVVESAEVPARPDRRGVAVKALLGLIFGGMIGLCWAVGRELLATSRQRDPGDYAEFLRLKQETSHELVSLWRRIRTLGRSGRGGVENNRS